MKKSVPLLLAAILMALPAVAQKPQIRNYSTDGMTLRELPAECAIRRGILCDTQRFPELSTERLIAEIADSHPRFYFQLAERLFEAGDRDRATFWFYAGQLRYRFHLAAHPDRARGFGSEGEEFGTLFQTVGPPINEYAAGDIARLTAIQQEVLDWDEQTDNGFTSKTRFAAEWQETRRGLAELREYMIQNADELRREREQNGLTNRDD